MYQKIRSQTHHHQTHHRANMIFPMTANTENLKANDTIKRKSIVNARNRTCQNHRQENLIFPTKVIVKARDEIKIRATGKGTLSNYAEN